jgi:hypothetical protein
MYVSVGTKRNKKYKKNPNDGKLVAFRRAFVSSEYTFYIQESSQVKSSR